MKSIEHILERNSRVELDKVWETSYTRRGIIDLITYGVASFFMMRIGVRGPVAQRIGTHWRIPTFNLVTFSGKNLVDRKTKHK